MDSWLKQAREASELTVEQCAASLRKPVGAYVELEQRPGLLRLNEIAALQRTFNGEGKRIVKAAMQEL